MDACALQDDLLPSDIKELHIDMGSPDREEAMQLAKTASDNVPPFLDHDRRGLDSQVAPVFRGDRYARDLRSRRGDRRAAGKQRCREYEQSEAFHHIMPLDIEARSSQPHCYP